MRIDVVVLSRPDYPHTACFMLDDDREVFERGFAEGAKRERARIVAWLRDKGHERPRVRSCCRIADEIECGEHEKE